jgi:hypothetical protein
MEEEHSSASERQRALKAFLLGVVLGLSLAMLARRRAS